MNVAHEGQAAELWSQMAQGYLDGLFGKADDKVAVHGEVLLWPYSGENQGLANNQVAMRPLHWALFTKNEASLGADPLFTDHSIPQEPH